MKRPYFAALSVLFAGVVLARPLLAETIRVVDGPRVRLADVTEVGSDELANFDLGKAPPPGSSRLFSRDDLARELRNQGFDPKPLKLPATVRVASPSRRFTSAELSSLVRPATLSALPAGVTLIALSFPRAITTTPRIEVGTVHLPKLPRKAGPVSVTATVELIHGGEVLLRAPVSLRLNVSDQAALPAVERGARVDLVILRGSARISASGTALEAAEVGEVASFKVSTTRKIVRARVESRSSATVVTP